MAKQRGRRRTPRVREARRTEKMVFGRRNYVLILAGIALVVVGYAIMRIENDVDGFTSLFVAPLLILGGYLSVIYAILASPEKARETETSPGT